VRKGDFPHVGLTEHPAPDGRTVCIAVNYASEGVSCPVEVDGEIVRCFKGEVKDRTLRLPPNDAVVFELAHSKTMTNKKELSDGIR